MNKATTYIDGEYLISDEDAFIYQVIKHEDTWLCRLVAANNRELIGDAPDSSILSEMVDEMNLRRFVCTELKADDEFTYNQSDWKVAVQDNGTLGASASRGAAKSNAVWGMHHFRSHCIVVTNLFTLASNNDHVVAELPPGRYTEEELHEIATHSGKKGVEYPQGIQREGVNSNVVNIPLPHATKTENRPPKHCHEMSVPERLDVLLARLDDLADIERQVRDDVAYIKELCGVKD